MPINPNRDTVDGDPAYESLADLPESPTIVNFVVPPHRTLRILQQCKELGLLNVWVQPGAESDEVIDYLDAEGFNYLANSCIMVRSRALTLDATPLPTRRSLPSRRFHAKSGTRFDVIVIGSGFGGSVSALRLTERGYRVAVMESGTTVLRRPVRPHLVESAQVPLVPAPRLAGHPAHRPPQAGDGAVGRRCRRRVTGLRQHAPGANRRVLHRIASGATSPTGRANSSPTTPAPRRMLGSTPAPADTPADDVMAAVASHFELENGTAPTDVAVYFGRPGPQGRRPLLRWCRA